MPGSDVRRASFRFGGQEHFYLESQAAWAEPGEDGDDVRAFLDAASVRDSGGRLARAARPAAQGRRAKPAHGRRLRRQGNAGQHLGRARRARRAAHRAARARAAQPRPGHDPHRQAPPVSRAVRGRASSRTARCARCASNFSPTAAGRSIFRARSPTARCSTSTTRITFRTSISAAARCKTNLVSNTAFRGFGGPQGMLVIEEIIDARGAAPGPAAGAGARAQSLPRQRRDEHDPLRPGNRRQPAAPTSGTTLQGQQRFRRAAARRSPSGTRRIRTTNAGWRSRR